MNIAYYHVDCFTENLFSGNPAAVCVMSAWLSDALMQTMAAEHHLPATAFIVEENHAYGIRWFSPDGEIELCGHGSIAASSVVFNYLKPAWLTVTFISPQHTVIVSRDQNNFTLDFPAQYLQVCTIEEALLKVLGIKPLAVYKTNTYLVLLENEQQVRKLQLDTLALRQLNCRNILITAPGDKVDFVSRNFYPKKTVMEDPVTGSAHCILAPFWAKRLNKNRLYAQQVSARGGELICEVNNERVLITGSAILYQKGEIILPKVV